MLHSIILYLIHAFIDFFFYIRILYRNLRLCLQRCLSLTFTFFPIFEPKKQVWIKKLPSHIGIIVCEDRISLSDISNIIVWCLCQGVHHVSIYDDSGFIKANGMKLYHKANQRKDQYLKKKSCSFSLIFSDGRTPFIYNTFVKNGHKTESMQVYLLTCGDGKQQIIKAARCFCIDAKKNPAILEDFHAKNFDKYLKGMINIPDPEMIILFGERRGLIGYLPWHIRLSEIIFHPTHHNMHFKEFQEVLLRYSKCEQRLGK